MRAAVVALGLCLVVSACGKSGDKTVVIPGQNGSAVVSSNDNGQHVVIKTADNKTALEFNQNGLGNTTMPDFAPLYPGAQVKSSVNAAGATGTGAMVSFQTSASPADVIAFYREKAHSAGLADMLNMTQDDNMTFMASKDKKSVQVIVAKSNGTTSASVTFSNGQ